MAGHEIDIGANVRPFQKGVTDVEAALEQVSDALDDAARDAQRAGDQMGDSLADGARDGARKAERGLDDISDSLKDVSRDAGRAGRELGDEISDGAKEAARGTEKVERSFKEIADASKRDTKSAGDALKRNVKDGAEGASEAVDEFKDEAVANLSETVSSFRGEAEDIAQIAQDTLGGVVANLGPVGMAAGVAGAAGIGMIMAALEQGAEDAQAMRERVAELAGQLIEIGGDPVAQLDAIVEGLKELASESEEGETSLADLRRAAEGSASGFRRLADAYAGNTDELRSLLKAERDRLAAAEEAYNYDKRWDAEKTKNLREQRDGLRTIVDGLDEASTAAEEAAAEEAAWLASNGPAYEAKANAIESLQGELDKAIGSYGEFVNAETGATDPAGYIANMQSRMDATANFNENVQQLAQQFGLSHDEVQAILDQGVDFAPMLQSILDSGMGEQYAETIRAMLDGGQTIVDGTPLHATVTGEADTDSAVSALEKASEDRDTTIKGNADTRAAARQIDGVADKRRTATITARASTAQANAQLLAAARSRTAHITAQASIWAAENALDRLTRPRTVQVTVDQRTREGRPIQ